MNFGNNSDQDWDKLSEKDQYYWVTTFEKYRDEKMSDDRREEFFGEASDYLNKLLAIIRRHIDPSFQVSRALDFGCGAGRVAVPLAKEASEVIGLDIAKGMLSEARKNSELLGLSNLKVGLSDDSLSEAPGTFNFIHSIYVFQHISFPRGKAIVRQMLNQLDEGGILSLQFLISNDLSTVKKVSYWLRVHVPFVKNILNLVNRKKWSAPMMQLNSYPLNSVVDLLKAGGCDQFYLRNTKDGPYNGVIVMAKKQKQDDFIDLGDIP